MNPENVLRREDSPPYREAEINGKAGKGIKSMRLVDLMERRSARQKLASFEPDRNSPLSDPERPGYVAPHHTANALFVHLERALSGAEPALNPAWHELLSAAKSVRNQQLSSNDGLSQAERVRPAVRDSGDDLASIASGQIVEPRTTAPSAPALTVLPAQISSRENGAELEGEALETWVEAATRRETFLAMVDAAAGPEKRVDARRAIDSHVLKSAFVKGAKGTTPTIDVDGFDMLWNGREGKAFQAAMMRLARHAKQDAKERNDEISLENMERPEDELIALINPRETMADWSRQMNAEQVGRGVVETKAYEVVMQTDEEAVVMKGFIDIGLKAIDDKRMPSKAELAADVAKLRDAFSKPEYQLKTEVVTAPSPVKGEGPVTRSSVRAVVRRQALTSPGRDFKGGTGVSGIDEKPETVHSLLAQNRRIVGLEGQKNYHSDDVVRAEMGRLVADRKTAPMMISHAPEGSLLRGSLLSAAEKLGVPVIRAELKLHTVSVKTDTLGTVKHFDGEYATPMISQRELRATCEIRAQFGANQPAQRVAIDSSAARAAAKGSLVLVDVKDASFDNRHEKKLFQASVNHAALVANDFVGFGVERHDKAFARVVGRRMMSGYDEPRILDKAGNVLTPAEIRLKIEPIGATPRQARAEDIHNDTSKLSTAMPFGQAVAVAAIGPEKAAPMLKAFKSLGEAHDAGLRVLGAPKEAANIASAYGIDVSALHGAAAYVRAARDTDRFAQTVARTKEKWDTATKGETQILANPSDRLVQSGGTFVGFSTIRTPGGELLAPHNKAIAIIGDERPVSENLGRNIDIAVAKLAETYGRDDAGVARVRLMTTLSVGTGEAVMEAALRHKVPVEAIGHKDDGKFKAGTDDMRLFNLASDVEAAGLGGTWSAHPYTKAGSAPTPETAARIAMEAADATVVTRVSDRERLTLTIAATAQTRPVLVMPASDAEPRAYSGNHALTAPDRTIGAAFDMTGAQVTPLMQNATFSQRKDRNAMVLYGMVDTKAGSPKLQSATDMGRVKDAAEGKTDVSMSRRRPMSAMSAQEANRIGVRHDVLGEIDYDRFHEKGYSKALDLTPVERQMAESIRLHHAENTSLISRRTYERLEDRFAGGTPRERAESLFRKPEGASIGG